VGALAVVVGVMTVGWLVVRDTSAKDRFIEKDGAAMREMHSDARKLPAPQRIPSDQLSSLDAPVLAIMAGESVMHDAT
jgi:hypothetical protein